MEKLIQQRNANKFNKSITIRSINLEMKTFSTENIYKIHMDNRKREKNLQTLNKSNKFLFHITWNLRMSRQNNSHQLRK